MHYFVKYRTVKNIGSKNIGELGELQAILQNFLPVFNDFTLLMAKHSYGLLFMVVYSPLYRPTFLKAYNWIYTLLLAYSLYSCKNAENNG